MKKEAANCPLCGMTGVVWHTPKQYNYRECGLANVVLLGGVRQATCKSCGEALIHIEEEQQLLQVIAISVLQKPAPLTGPEIRFLRAEADITQTQLAGFLKTRQPTISDWERSRRPPIGDLAKELGCRLVLLSAFWDFLKENPERKQLHDSHVKQLQDFSQLLVKSAREFLHQTRLKKQVRVRMDRDQWEAQPLAA